MDPNTWVNAGLVLVFIFIGGSFAGTEIALISLRESQLSRMAQQSARGARVADVARDPNRFLATVQIGVTVAGTFSAAYGASTLAPDFVPALERVGLPTGLADAAALILLTLVISYLSLVLGELVPKRFALQRSAAVALLTAPSLDRFATFMRPVVWLLSVSTNTVMRALGGDPSAKSEQMSGEEVRELVIAHESLADDERRILSDLFDAAGRTIAEVMRPRGEVAFIAADLSLEDAAALVRGGPFSRYPVTGEGFDDVVGFVHVRDLLGAPEASTTSVAEVMREIIALPATNRVLSSMSHLRREGAHIAIVVDEYGGTDGIVTLEDLVEELIGDIRDEYDQERTSHPVAHDGVIDVDAALSIEDFAKQSGVVLQDGPYETVAGYVIARLGRLAVKGDAVIVDGHRLVVIAVSHRRITHLQVTQRVGEPHEEGHT